MSKGTHRLAIAVVLAIITTSHIEASHGWSQTGSMSAPRMGQAATPLADGRVLVSGGQIAPEFSVETADGDGYRRLPQQHDKERLAGTNPGVIGT